MTEFYDKHSIHQILIQPVKHFGKIKTRDKIDVLNLLKPYADLYDVEYIYPLVFDKDNELALVAACVSASIMRKVQGKYWNKVYDIVKYTKVEFEAIDSLLKFPGDKAIHLLGIASLNSSGYIREKAIRNFLKVSSSSAIPYILLRLNDWVSPVRSIAEYTLKYFLSLNNVDAFIEHSYLIAKLQNNLRVEKIATTRIINWLKDDSVKDKIKNGLGHPQIKTCLFCYKLLSNRILVDEDIVNSALKDKSFEIRMWLVETLKATSSDKTIQVVSKLIDDKSAKVVTAVLRNFEEIVCIELNDVIVKLVTDNRSSVRDEARFIAKKHSLIQDFPEYYRKQLSKNPTPGAIVGLGETGCRTDFTLVSSFSKSNNTKIKSAAITAMWYLSKDEAINYVLKELDSEIPRIKKTARKIILSSRMPHVVYELKTYMESDKLDIKLFALTAICKYGGWHALEAILFAITFWMSPEKDKAKSLLDNWLIKSASLYNRPESTTYSNITGLFELVKNKRLISEKSINELSFIFKTRGL